ncbi:MAG: ABC transporter ATP-binding protein, partial [Actinomycetota bacterium]
PDADAALPPLIGGMAGVIVAQAALGAAVSLLMVWTTARATASLRYELIDRLQGIDRTRFMADEPARLHAILVADSNRAGRLARAVVSGIVPNAVTLAFIVPYLFWINPLLSSILAVVVPVTYGVDRALRSRVETSAREDREAFHRFDVSISRALRIWDLTVAQTAEREERRRVTDRIDGRADAMVHLERWSAGYRALQSVIVGMTGLIALLVGGVAVRSGSMTTGSLISYFVVLVLAQGAARRLLGAMPGVLAGNEVLASLSDWLGPEGRVDPIEPADPTFEPDGSFRFDGVRFAYPELPPILDDMTVSVGAGEFVALSGPNGSGKTTMINLLLGWYRPQRGSITVAGRPLGGGRVGQWRERVALVQQEPRFFAGTVRDNLLYGSGTRTDGELWAAARIATADTVIEQLDDGLNTELAEDGMNLSGGERQRLALARGIVRDPLLLVLDEPTNHLDRGSVERLVENVEQLRERPTIVLITHDQGLLARADRVIDLRVPALG